MDDSELQFGRFRLDTARRVLLGDGVPVRLGPRATDLLWVLVQRRGSVVSKAELFDLVWPGLAVEENNLQQHISALRKLFGPQAIATVPGRGYMFTLTPDGEPATSHDLGRDAGVVPRHAPVRPTHEPAGAPLIGRDAELSELRERVYLHAVVTVVGPGGIGKTRLALAVAQACQAEFADGVCVVDLSVLTDGGQAPAAVAQALGIVSPLEPAAELGTFGRHAQTIASALRQRELLLVLDNCECVLDAVASLVDVLRQRARHVRVLATSQEPLHLADEQIFRLGPLDVPPSGRISAADAADAGAVQLFVARAQAVDRRLSLTSDMLPAVIDICRRLDGLPLAIELAAARLPLLGVHGLQQRLDERLGVLGARPGRGPRRQQTIRAALTWSHALLNRDEQIVWRRLSVFAGGFSLDLAHRVLVDADFAPESVLDHLGALIDKSLLVAETGGNDPRCLRYRLLEPARAFALTQLEQADELDTLRLRHANALGDFLKSYDERVVHERRFDVVVGRMAGELTNLRAAMRWLADLIAHPSATATVDRRAVRHLAITLAAYGDWLWSEVDSFGEGLRFCRLARDCLDGDVPIALSARLRLSHQLLARTRLRPAAEWAVDGHLALKEFREVGDRVGLYRALCALGGAPRAVVRDDESIALLREAEQLEAPDWSPVLRRRRQAALEWCHDQGGRDEACREAGLRSVTLAHEAGGVGEIAALGNLADTEFALGLVDDAIKSCRRAISVATELQRPEEAFNAFQHMVPALLERGSLAEAEAAIRQGRDVLVRSLGSASGMLMPLALLQLKRGEGRLALQLVGCADRARLDEGLDLYSPERRIREAILASMRPVVAEAEMSALLASGALWDGDQGFAVAGLG